MLRDANEWKTDYTFFTAVHYIGSVYGCYGKLNVSYYSYIENTGFCIPRGFISNGITVGEFDSGSWLLRAFSKSDCSFYRFIVMMILKLFLSIAGN